jgi:hypothetical protein
MRWPWVSREQVDVLREIVEAQAKMAREFKSDAERERREQQERYDALLAKYHELAKPAPVATAETPQPVVSPLSQLGPLTQAALREASIGLPNLNRRAMEAKVLTMAANKIPDDKIAHAIQTGEAVKIVA